MCLGEAAHEHLSGDGDKRRVEGALLRSIQGQFVSLAVEAKPENSRTAGAPL